MYLGHSNFFSIDISRFFCQKQISKILIFYSRKYLYDYIYIYIHFYHLFFYLLISELGIPSSGRPDLPKWSLNKSFGNMSLLLFVLLFFSFFFLRKGFTLCFVVADKLNTSFCEFIYFVILIILPSYSRFDQSSCHSRHILKP